MFSDVRGALSIQHRLGNVAGAACRRGPSPQVASLDGMLPHRRLSSLTTPTAQWRGAAVAATLIGAARASSSVA